MDAVVLAHAAATWFMTGLIWTIQVVHYPLFARVGARGFEGFEAEHSRRITALLAVPWPLEVVTAVWIAVSPGPVPRVAAVVGALLAGAVAVVTVLVQVPLHQRLGEGYDPAAHRRLVATNWVRTALWSARSAIALGMVVAI